MSHPSPAAGHTPRRSRALDAIRHRPRIYICAAVMVVVYFLVPNDLRVATRALIAWNVAAFLFIALIGWMMARSNERSIRAQAAVEDERRPAPRSPPSSPNLGRSRI
jgi:uncharacterized membrane protein